MQYDRSMARRLFDQRFAGLNERIGPRPEKGWVRTLRDALGMSALDLAVRMRLHPSRIGQIERAELDGSLRMSTLARTAEALNCRLAYVLLPNEELEEMVWRQAFIRAAEEIGEVESDDLDDDSRALAEAVRSEELEALAYRLIDHRGLWRRLPQVPQLAEDRLPGLSSQPGARAGPEPPGPPPGWPGGP